MRILFVSAAADSLGMAFRCHQEGCQVVWYVHGRDSREIGRGLLKTATDWRAWVPWADLVVFDSTRMKFKGQEDYGGSDWAQEVRRKGKPYIGGSHATDDLEHDRLKGEAVWEALGLKGQPMHQFKGPGAFDKAKQFVEANPDAYACKHNADVSKALATVQWTTEATIDFLDWLKDIWPSAGDGQTPDFVLQPAVRGVEISTTALFDGRDWRGVHILQEYKRLLPGDFGPMTGAMGEMAHEQKSAKLWRIGMDRLGEWLRKQGYHGCIDLSFIATEEGIVPLEWTPRFGYGSVYSILTLTDGPVSDWLWTLATGEGNIRTRGGYACYFSVGSGTYPQSDPKKNDHIRILGDWSDDNVWLSAVRLDAHGQLCIAGDEPHLLYCSGWGREVQTARDEAWRSVESIQVLPYMTIRDDVGRHFTRDWARLQQWGWVN